MNFTPEELNNNYKKLLNNINKYITRERKNKLLDLYSKLEERLIVYPASIKNSYHSAIPGGYVDHINRVVDISLDLIKLWGKYSNNLNTFTLEELVFSAINHDLGKIGTMEEDLIIPQTDEWRKNKLGELYQYNSNIDYLNTQDRSLYLLQVNNIKCSLNETIAIRTYAGLYDEANNSYFTGYNSETKPKSCLPYILHHADVMAVRIEFENGWLFSNKKVLEKSKNNVRLNKNTNAKALNLKGSKALKELLEKT